MYQAPQASTWSRAHHYADAGQRPLRTRAEPLVISTLDSNALDKVLASNKEMKVFLDRRAGFLVSFNKNRIDSGSPRRFRVPLLLGATSLWI